MPTRCSFEFRPGQQIVTRPWQGCLRSAEWLVPEISELRIVKETDQTPTVTPTGGRYHDRPLSTGEHTHLPR